MPQHPTDWITTEARRADAQALRCYIQRGRPLAGESDEHLDALWIAGVRAWAVAPYSRSLSLDDAEAELSIRGRQLPESQVAAETTAIIEGLGRTLEAMPAAITRSMVAEAMAGASGPAASS